MTPKSIFLDTNVVIDLLGHREPFVLSAAKILSLADTGKIKITISALTYATTFYVLSRDWPNAVVKNKLQSFKVIVSTADLTDIEIDKGLTSHFSDFEDALQYYCALKSECEIFITRNTKDFKKSNIPVMTPDEYLGSLAS